MCQYFNVNNLCTFVNKINEFKKHNKKHDEMICVIVKSAVIRRANV